MGARGLLLLNLLLRVLSTTQNAIHDSGGGSLGFRFTCVAILCTWLFPAVDLLGEPALAKAAADSAKLCTNKGRVAVLATKEVNDEVNEEVDEEVTEEVAEEMDE